MFKKNKLKIYMKLLLIVFLIVFIFFIISKEEYVNYPSDNNIIQLWKSSKYFKNFNDKDKIAR